MDVKINNVINIHSHRIEDDHPQFGELVAYGNFIFGISGTLDGRPFNCERTLNFTADKTEGANPPKGFGFDWSGVPIDYSESSHFYLDHEGLDNRGWDFSEVGDEELREELFSAFVVGMADFDEDVFSSAVTFNSCIYA